MTDAEVAARTKLAKLAQLLGDLESKRAAEKSLRTEGDQIESMIVKLAQALGATLPERFQTAEFRCNGRVVRLHRPNEYGGVRVGVSHYYDTIPVLDPPPYGNT